MEPTCFVFSSFICLKMSSPLLLQLLRRMLQRCFALKPQRCFVYEETSANSPTEIGGGADDWTFNFE